MLANMLTLVVAKDLPAMRRNISCAHHWDLPLLGLLQRLALALPAIETEKFAVAPVAPVALSAPSLASSAALVEIERWEGKWSLVVPLLIGTLCPLLPELVSRHLPAVVTLVSPDAAQRVVSVGLKV